MRQNLILLVVLFIGQNVVCQIDSIIDFINKSEFQFANSIVAKQKDKQFKEELQSYLDYEQNGIANRRNEDFRVNPDFDSDQHVLKLLLKGHDHYFANGNNGAAKREYDRALVMAKRIDNGTLICASLRSLLRLFYYIDAHEGYNKYFEPYLRDYSQYAKKEIDISKQQLYRFRLALRLSKEISQNTDIEYELANESLRLSQNSLIKGHLYRLNAEYHVRKKQRNSDSVYYYFSKSKQLLSQASSIEDRERKVSYYTGLGAFYIEEGQPELGLKYLDSVNMGFHGFLKKYTLLYNYIWKIEAFKILGLKDSILSAENNYLKLDISMGQDKSKSEIADLQEKYESKKTEKKLLIEQQQKVQNRNIALGLGGLLVFGGITFFLVQKNTTKKRRLAEQESLLKQQKVETLLKEQELTSIDAMIAGQEKERTKVANELHDDLGSLMATVKLHFDNVKVDQKDPALMNAQKLLDEAYQKIRGMAHSKNSGVMANQGLLPAVKNMAKTINETNALTVSVEDFGLGERMENSLELTIFRMIQELIANVIKHAQATKATIQFTQHEDNLNIIVEDNGKGFDMTAVKRTQNGMGLGTIEKRIEHLEGAFTVDSVLGKGTSILIDIPI